MKYKTEKSQYEESFKLEVLRDYYEQGLNKSETARKWGIYTRRSIDNWIKQYPVDSKHLSLSSETIERYMKENPIPHEKSKEELLENQVENLKKALEMEKLRSRGYEIMIELAEKQEGIQIRKKPGAKR